ncbi:WD repeat-containing protein mip1 [Neolecta irregularis DAH-3]|uniref:WD repeat-containing protein mip1 n=1 Tax=Neolecta irregularis (strain DAH-3) TaxID=1198029 RepID=A0A1U7LKA7_NEOID|nr:WD repeat-containing protein mip1 [Neolecta irregularis DAH-3]|eukprot:OLL23090.1 WD repeat-containing protein mip1 [Neolecta irregularis DAH-3]
MNIPVSAQFNTSDARRPSSRPSSQDGSFLNLSNNSSSSSRKQRASQDGSHGQLTRSNTVNSTHSHQPSVASENNGELDWANNTTALSQLRHGLDEDTTEEFLDMLNQVYYMYFTDKRHMTCGNPKVIEGIEDGQDWRMKDRLKTVAAALVLCLNIGVDPPDIVKTNPCAKLECWLDPTGHQPPKAIDEIGKHLQQQYESLSMRTRYKPHLDPSVEDTKKFCCNLRRSAKEERVLFHYNGHGVPKPTSSGEIWVFNKSYTQYIPVSLYDLQIWLGAPCLYVWDCNASGNIVTNFKRFAQQRDDESARMARLGEGALLGPSHRDCIHLAACQANEQLPMNPDLPADLFTSCLTTPIEIAVRWFVLQSPIPMNISVEAVEQIPGKLQDRRTPLGELNWIFTAITDTIAWSVLPKSLFKKLFRQDLMVAALFRNFLLAQRIMRIHQCLPISEPPLPPTYNHSMWDAWDLAIDACLAQLPKMIEAEKTGEPYEYQHSTFFSEQLNAFRIWLDQGAKSRKPPDQLPIVLQVLLSQVHRFSALFLLSRFLDLGPWAVDLALSIGIFPYVLKLLQSPVPDLKPVLIFIWARILAVDGSCQSDLLKDDGYTYFSNILPSDNDTLRGVIPEENIPSHKAMCAFILSVFCRGSKEAQAACLRPCSVLAACLRNLQDGDPLLRQWSCLCLSELWKDNDDAKMAAISETFHEILCPVLEDPVPEVRCASVVALTTFLGATDISEQVTAIEQYLGSAMLAVASDGSCMVRKEVVIFMSAFISRYQDKFLVTALEVLEEQQVINDSQNRNDVFIGMLSRGTIFAAVWKLMLILAVDPQPEIAQMAQVVVDLIMEDLTKSSLSESLWTIIQDVAKPPSQQRPGLASRATSSYDIRQSPRSHTSVSEESTLRYGVATSRLANTLKRSAVSLKNLAIGYSDLPSGPGSVHDKAPSDTESLSTPKIYLSSPVQPMPKYFHPLHSRPDSKIPLKGAYYDWSKEYFMEPQMRALESDEPGSVDYNQRLWRRNRNEKIIYDTQPLKELAGSSPWNIQLLYFNNETNAKHLLFHQYESHLVCTDDRDSVAVWDWEHGIRLNKFYKGNPTDSRITDIKFINEDDVALLMLGTGDGIIRVYRNYWNDEVEPVSAWRALTDLVKSDHRGSGLVTEWQQGRGTLLVGGDVKVIRVWDAPGEICAYDIPARSGSCVTSISSDQVAGNVFVAGFGDGAVRVYDKRNKPRDSMVRSWKEHKSWVSKVHLQRGGNRELASACVDGDIRLWDIRNSKSLRVINAHKTLKSFAVHEHAPVMATGTLNHIVKVWNMTGSCLSTFSQYSGFLPHGNTNVSALAFHPHKMALASAGSSYINITTAIQEKK